MPLRFLTQDNFPLLLRTRELIDHILNSTPGRGRMNAQTAIDYLVAPALTTHGIKLYETGRFDQAEEVLVYAVKIQECLYHPTHPELIDPLIALGGVYVMRRRFEEATLTLLRALPIAAKTEAKIEKHELILTNLIYVFHEGSRPDDETRMRNSLARLRGENAFIVKDRPNRRSE